ncbi:MAG TPA: nuclear transport factor 2 family protein [Actinomycetota bacterium]|nr:nuclear transport factor 2 family protein [Actinomycetota bacterium]
MSTQEPGSIGSRFVDAIAAKDARGLGELFDRQVGFRGLTPHEAFEAQDPDGVIEILLGSWFEPPDHVQEILEVRTDPVAGRVRLRYRLRVESGGEQYLVDQQGYYDAADGRITRMSLVCAGFQPWPD